MHGFTETRAAGGARMAKIEIVEGHYYRGKTTFLRKVMWASPTSVRWHDRIGPGECAVSTFRSWLRSEVADGNDPEIAQVEARIAESENESAKVFEGMAAAMEELHTSRDITVWTSIDQMPPVMRRLYSEAKGRKTKLRWICWVPAGKEAPAFCTEANAREYVVKGKGAFRVRFDAPSESELVSTAFMIGCIMREEEADPIPFRQFRTKFVALGAENDLRVLRALYNVWAAGYNSVESGGGDVEFLRGRGRPDR